MDILKNYIDHQNDHHSTCLDLSLSQASIFVVIPCYNEPDIFHSLNSLAACSPSKGLVTVLVVVNDPEDAPKEVVEQNNLTLKSIAQWQQQHGDSFPEVRRISARSLPQKWAGVGWARKIGMDEAVRQIVTNNFPDGIIISFDADSTVMPNYLQTIERAFDDHPKFNFFTIHFEHPFDTIGLEPFVKEGIIRYELHMRYYRNALQWCGYPHAIHTVGSSFAVKASAYAMQGGMNRRKAGEDFYFLHKMVLLGQYGNISSTTVFPASRQSDRVPFGTGAALKKWVEGSTELNSTYSLGPFQSLRSFFSNASQFWSLKSPEIDQLLGSLDPVLQKYLQNSGTIFQLAELRRNCSNATVFERRFFHLINAFWILKYLNFAHENSWSRADLQSEPIKLLQYLDIQTEINLSLENILKIFRDLDQRVENCR